MTGGRGRPGGDHGDNSGAADAGARSLALPLTPEDAKSLRAGDRVLLCGPLYTARDAAHARMADTLASGGQLPVDLAGQLIYYSGPTPAPPGRVIGSAGPTTSARMDAWTPPLLQLGLSGAVGKGERSAETRHAFRLHGAVYFLATGGAGALLARCVKTAEVVAYEDLGTEAVRRLVVHDFPVVVAWDAHGGDLFTTARKTEQRSS